MSGSTPLTPDEKHEAFCRATRFFVERYAEEIAEGMTDIQLETALKNYLGIFGGSCGPGSLDITYQGAGLKIWASREIHNHVTARPIFQDAATVKMARYVYNIAEPGDNQLSLI